MNRTADHCEPCITTRLSVKIGQEVRCLMMTHRKYGQAVPCIK